MTETLRDWADTCEQIALDALDESRVVAAKESLQVAMLLDQRADYIDTRNSIVDAEVVDTRVRDLLAILEQVDDLCRERIETGLYESEPIVLFAQHIRDLVRVPLS